MEAPIVIDGEVTEEKVQNKDPLPSTTNITKQSDLETSEEKIILSPHFKNIFGLSNKPAMTPEEQNANIRDTFANDD